jgi:hypothetical protein
MASVLTGSVLTISYSTQGTMGGYMPPVTPGSNTTPTISANAIVATVSVGNASGNGVFANAVIDNFSFTVRALSDDLGLVPGSTVTLSV